MVLYMEEDDFKKIIVIPTLRRIGFEEIRDNHGIREFGKDIIFSKYDEFGLKRFYGAQVKAKDINGCNAGEIDDIISHATRAFIVPFTDIITKKEYFIDEFYIIISGKFLGNAIDIIRSSDKISSWGRLIHFIDGEFIQKLYSQNVKTISKLINETIRESRRNIEICRIILKTIDDVEKGEAPLNRLSNYNLKKLLSEGLLENDEENVINRKLEFLIYKFSYVNKKTYLEEIPIIEININKLITKLIKILPSSDV